MKTIESRIAPNPKEAQIWIDLSADAHGLVKKYWNGSKWIIKDENNSIYNTQAIKRFESELKSIKDQLTDMASSINFLNTHHDEYILGLIKNLANRITKIEEVVVIE